MKIDLAVDIWTAQLMTASQHRLRVDWLNEEASLVLADCCAVTAVLRGGTVSTDDIDDLDLDRLEAVIHRAQQVGDRPDAHRLSLVVGAVDFGDNRALPLILCDLSTKRAGRKVRRWTIRADTPPVVCAVTKDILSRDYGVAVDIPTGDWHKKDVFDEFVQLCPEVSLDATSGLVVHASGLLDVRRDIRTFPELSESGLIGALAGEPERQHSLRSPHALSDSIADTILPADASQRDVIRHAVDGETLVVEGPPGTGKSQTIANLLAELVAADRTVLLVTEKPTAAQIVLERFEEAGLAHLVLDIHDSTKPVDLSIRRSVRAPVPTIASSVPALVMSKEHHRVIAELLPLANRCLGDSREAPQRITLGSARQILAEIDVAERAISVAAQIRREISQAGIDFQIDQSEKLADLADDLDRLALLTDRDVLRTRAPDEVLAILATSQALMDLRDVVDLRCLAIVAMKDPERAVSSSLTDPSIRLSVTNSIGMVTTRLRDLGVYQTGGTVGQQIQVAELTLGSWRGASSLSSRLADLRWEPSSIESDAGTATRALADSARLAASNRVGLGLLRMLPRPDDVLNCSDPETELRRVVLHALLGDSRIHAPEDMNAEADEVNSRLEHGNRIRGRVIDHIASRRKTSYEASAIVLEGLERRARRIPVSSSRILADHLDAILAKFPIVVASPWSVARCLPQIAEIFDVVVFDEASQLELPAAVPSLARARSAVVFGDTYQLPPNLFFRSEAEFTDDPVLGQVSLLDAFSTMMAGSAQTRMLGWHYRSEDDRLIEYVASSPVFYGGTLVASPGPPNLAHPITFRKADAAEMVALAADSAVASTSEGTVGVVTYGTDLADDIRGELRRRCVADIEVRSVERFQGAERDSMVVVMPMSDDSVSPLQALGPINQRGGERRLNVAITRARRRMVVLSTFDSSDLSSAQSIGAQAVRDFLSSVESTSAGDADSSPSETRGVHGYVASLLRSAGLNVKVYPERTAAAVRITAAIAGGVPVAIDIESEALCAMPALNREIIRRKELTRRGWHVHRTTLRDWFLQPDETLRSVVSAVEGRHG